MIANSRNGTASSQSMNRASTESTSPPKYPAASPMIVPPTTVTAVATTPTNSEIRAP